MSDFRKIPICVMFVAMLLVFSLPTFAAIFEDDFEADEIGAQPSKWKIIDEGGKWPGKIAEDPDDPDNKILVTSVNGYRGGTVYVAGEPDMKHIIVEFDWRYQNPGGEYTVAFRYQDKDNCYTFGKLDGTNFTCRKRFKGEWSELARVARSAELEGGVWYRFQLIAQGVEFTIKVKDKKDKTPFSEIEPFITAMDGEIVGEEDDEQVIEPDEDAFMEGYFALYGSMALNSGRHDNVRISKTSPPPGEAVEPVDKLVTTWADIKRSQ